MAKSYYEILEISDDAKEPEIRRAYRNVLRKYHPDLHPNQRKAAKRSRQLNAALGVLTNPAERARYDAKLKRIERRKKRAEEKAKRKSSSQNSHSTYRKTYSNPKRKTSSGNRANRQPGPRPGFKQRSTNGSTRHTTGKKQQRSKSPKWEKKPERKRNRKKPNASRWNRSAEPFKHIPQPELDYQHGLAIGIFVGAVLIILLLALLVLLGLVELKMLDRSLIEFFT
eukprot:COSAG01_NODE_21_length_38221_cov_1796.647028_22_plen_226_part_00